MKRSILMVAVVAALLIVGAVAQASPTVSLTAPGRESVWKLDTEDYPDRTVDDFSVAATLTFGETGITFDVNAYYQAYDGTNSSDNEYLTIEANGKYLKYNMYNGNTTPGWGTSWSNATNPLPDGVTFIQTQSGNDFVYDVTMSYDALGLSLGDDFDVQIKVRDYNDEYSDVTHWADGTPRGSNNAPTLFIADTGTVSVPEPATMALLGLGAVALISRRRRNRRTA